MVYPCLGIWTLDWSYFNFPAFLIVFILTELLVRGVRESAKANNIMVAIKIGAILVFLVIGGALVNPNNWHPFAPSGFGGIVTGGAIVFFTYIGFDSVSTAAEEARIRSATCPSASSPRSLSAPFSTSAFPLCCSA